MKNLLCFVMMCFPVKGSESFYHHHPKLQSEEFNPVFIHDDASSQTLEGQNIDNILKSPNSSLLTKALTLRIQQISSKHHSIIDLSIISLILKRFLASSSCVISHEEMTDCIIELLRSPLLKPELYADIFSVCLRILEKEESLATQISYRLFTVLSLLDKKVFDKPHQHYFNAFEHILENQYSKMNLDEAMSAIYRSIFFYFSIKLSRTFPIELSYRQKKVLDLYIQDSNSDDDA